MRGVTIGSNTFPLALRHRMGYSLENRRPGRVARRPLSTGKKGDGTLVSPGSEQVDPGPRGGETQRAFGERSLRAGWPGFLALAVALAAPLSAIWAVPWFVTQDGPAHVYNAQILAESFDPGSPSRLVYSISWKPIPNWMGHLVLAGLVARLPAWVADRIMTSATLVGLAAATLWLRWRVAGARGLVLAAFLSALLAMNFAWLLGFTSFLLGCCLFPITLGVWWEGRYRLSLGRIAALSALLCVGYFCHLVSLGLTAVGLVVLAWTGPLRCPNAGSWKFRMARLARTSISFVPLFVLGYFYLQAAKRSGPLRPVWEKLSSPWSPSAWRERIAWVDPITLAVKNGMPFTNQVSQGFIIFAPAVWLTIGLVLWWFGRITGRPSVSAQRVADDPAAPDPAGTQRPRDDRQGWLVLASLLLVGGIAGPDSFGAAHGEFLPLRLLILGFVALIPVFDADLSRPPGRFLLAAIAVAVALQSVIVWDYALYCDATAGQIIRAGNSIGRNKRIVTLLVSSHGRFRTNPLLHAENWLGVGTDNVVWSNYEALHYYFPVQFRPEIERPHPGDLELISIHEDPKDKATRLRDWEEKILRPHQKSIDVVLFWKSDPELEAITKRWFESVQQTGDVQIFQRARTPP
jgi:hypothetical protein